MCPVLFKFHSLTIYSYGFLVALGVLAVFCLTVSRAKASGFSGDTVSDLIVLLFVAGVIGARFFYVLQHFEEYRHVPVKVFSIQEGGLVWYGGFIFALTAGFIYAVLRKLPVLRLLDFFAPFIPLAHAIGRIGCFLNGCCFGKFTESRFGVLFPGEPAKRLPTQLYESAFLVLLFIFLLRLFSRKHRAGEIFISYVVLYSAARFLFEFLRGDQQLVFSLTIPQWSSLFLFAGAFAFLIYLKKRSA